MTPAEIVISLLIYNVLVVALSFYWGYNYAVTKWHLGDLNAYITTRFPTPWKAYQLGVREGYEQGLRDGQEIPDEPA